MLVSKTLLEKRTKNMLIKQYGDVDLSYFQNHVTELDAISIPGFGEWALMDLRNCLVAAGTHFLEPPASDPIPFDSEGEREARCKHRLANIQVLEREKKEMEDKIRWHASAIASWEKKITKLTDQIKQQKLELKAYGVQS